MNSNEFKPREGMRLAGGPLSPTLSGLTGVEKDILGCEKEFVYE